MLNLSNVVSQLQATTQAGPIRARSPGRSTQCASGNRHRKRFGDNSSCFFQTTRLWIDPDGRPHVPGNLQVWKDLFVNHPQGKYDAKLTRAAGAWKEADDVLEALFGLTRKSVENEQLKIVMALRALDRYRSKPLTPETVDLLARTYRVYGSQYAIFNEAATVSDKSIAQFMDTADALTHLKDPMLRADTLGIDR